MLKRFGTMCYNICMTPEQWEQKLKDEGYTHVVTHIDQPGVCYDEHEHPVDTAHVILTGMIELSMNGQKYNFRAGDRFDIPKHTTHNALVGSDGCTFLTGIKV